ncbi:MAG: DUF2807 domain-containing protein [Bacteroidales bacterium]|nr:DUF2807 domain-containing protein [Bacteroidales bacterium]
MRKIALILVAAVAMVSCLDVLGESGNGVSVQQVIEVGEFDSVSVPSFIDVYYTQTPGAQSLTLTCDENLVTYYAIVVENGTLKVKTKPNVSIRSKAKTFLTVNSPTLNELRLSGSGDVFIDGPIVADKDFSVSISGSGDINSTGVTADNISISLSGSGDCSLECKDAGVISVKISGSGDVTLKGNARSLGNISLTGSGDLNVSGLSVGK